MMRDIIMFGEIRLMTYNQTAQHSTAQHSTAQHSTAQHSTAQHSTYTRGRFPFFFACTKTSRMTGTFFAVYCWSCA
ncbi:hypothetical protein AALM99_03045 [Lactococcus muris]|uniref:Uncharacterized protein n=1 Tax=Lactococcus muris TaxID=2941330 RepID=A0ABV4D6N4_9LACT